MQNIYKATSTATSKTLPQHHHKYLILKIHVAEMVYITGKTSRATAAWCSARRPWRTIKLWRWELMQDDSIGNQEQQRVRNSTTTTKSAHKSSKASWLAPADDNFLISHPDNKGNTCYTFGSQITTTWWFSWLNYLVIFIWMTTCVENVAKLLPSSCETLITIWVISFCCCCFHLSNSEKIIWHELNNKHKDWNGKDASMPLRS